MDLKGQMLLGVWTKFFSLGDAIIVPHFYEKIEPQTCVICKPCDFLWAWEGGVMIFPGTFPLWTSGDERWWVEFRRTPPW